MAVIACGTLSLVGCGGSGYEATYSQGDSSKVVYYLYDQRGDVTALVDSAGNVLREQSVYPYGEERAASGDLPPLYYTHTGKEYDAETGLVYFGGRYYLPELGRWITPDPLFLEKKPDKLVESPLEFNLYSYVRNSPFTFVDEDGFKLELAQGTSEEGRQQYNAAIAHFYAHGMGDLIDKLEAHPDTIYIHIVTDGKAQFDPGDASHVRIDWDPKSGLYVAQGPRDTWESDSKGGVIQSPAMGLYHEFGHAWGYLTGVYKEGIKEEMRVIKQYEIPAARKLDEPIRFRYHGSAIPVSNSTGKTSALTR